MPAFAPNPLAPDETSDAKGHIDVELTNSKFGDGRDIEIRDAVNASRAERESLVTLLARSRFRPRTTNGVFDGASRLAVRYYVYEESREAAASLR